MLRDGLRLTFGTLEHVAPEVGARLAARLWCTPPRRRSAPAFGSAAGGAAFTVRVNGGTVVGRAWGSGPAVYLVHGWGGWAGQLQSLVAPLVIAGYRVFSFDAPSHGRSGPGVLGRRRATVVEFADALSAVVRAGGPAHAVIAHSLGGTATGLAVLEGLPAHRLVFVAPMADPRPYVRAFRRTLGIGDAVGARLIRRVENLVGRPLADFDIPGRAAGASGLPPLLVVHDRGDREVGLRDGAALAAAWPGELHPTTGLGHHRVLRDPGIVERVVGFVRDRSDGHHRSVAPPDGAGGTRIVSATA